MAVPRRVKKREEEARRMHGEVYGQDTSEEAQAEDQNQPEANAEADEQQPSAEESAQEPQGEPQSEETEEPGEQPAAPSQENWEERYRVLKGKYDAEVPRLTRELRETRGQLYAKDQELKQITQRLDALEQQSHEAQRETRTPDTELEHYREQFGDDLLEVIDKVSERKARAMVDEAVQQRVQPLNERLDESERVQTQTAQERFNAALAEAVPDWEAINVRQEWFDWLAEVDEFSGQTRQQLLNDAAAQLDASRVINFFKRFKDESNAPASREQERRRHTAPPRSKGTEPPQQQPQYTYADWQKLQDEMRRGKYRGREEQAKQKEREIHAALFGASPQ